MRTFRSLALLIAGLSACCPVGIAAQSPAAAPARPPIFALDHVSVYAQDPAKSEQFYVGTLGARRVPERQPAGAARYYFNSLQYVEVLPLPADAGDARLAAVGFATTDSAALRTFVDAHGFHAYSGAGEKIGAEGTGGAEGNGFAVQDPEGNLVQFSAPRLTAPVTCFSDVSCHMIHAGFRVRDRAAEDRFYLRTLGFRPYWQGAMTAGKVDWISQQVPDGREWLEYMMTGPDSDHPAEAVTRADLGGMDHVSLAVGNMEATVTKLLAEHRLLGRYNGPQMGRDGKWQTNLYDPDGTRIELMEAEPTTDPCCSGYRAAHPGLRPTVP